MPNHATRDDIPSNAKTAAIDLLNARLADTIAERAVDLGCVALRISQILAKETKLAS